MTLYINPPARFGETWRSRGRYEQRGASSVWVRGETRRVYDVTLGRDVLYKVRGQQHRCTRTEWEAWKQRAKLVDAGTSWEDV